MLKHPPSKGDRLVYQGNMAPYATIHVEDVAWLPEEQRWLISVRWGETGEHGTSRLYLEDEGKVWYRYSSVS